MKTVFGVAVTAWCLFACICGVTLRDSKEKTAASKWRDARRRFIRALCPKVQNRESNTESPFSRDDFKRKALRRRKGSVCGSER